MAKRRILITGVSGFLGASLARALERSSDIEYVAGVALKEPPFDLGNAEFIKADIRSPLIYRVINSSEVDTVVHADLSSNPVRVGGRSAQKERNVIGTMQLLGACQRAERVTKVVFRSSTAVYGAEPGDPSILTEEWSNRAQDPLGYSKDVVDAETFARDFSRRRSDISMTILRMANVVGPRAETNLTQLFSLPVVPTAMGFDPRLQMLHEDDALEILRLATLEDHPGVYNVAADGILYLSQAIRRARRIALPIVSQFGQVTGDLLRRFGVVDFPSDQLSLIMYGRVVDTSRLKREFKYEPRFTTSEAFENFLSTRGRTPIGPSIIGELEMQFYDYVIRKSRSRFASTIRPYIVKNEEEPVVSVSGDDR